MDIKSRYFEIFPKVVRAGQKSIITVKPLFDHCRLKSNARYFFSASPLEMGGLEYSGGERIEIQPKEGVLKIELFFDGEQEHHLYIYEVTDQVEKEYLSFSVYSLKDDLFERKPYKGDMHMHSYYSDGTESPAYVAAYCRKIGLDFIAITDHGKYHPSLEAINAFQTFETDFKIFPGEEVHPPENEIHMINFGGKFSINELFKDKEKYMKEVEEIIKNLESKRDSSFLNLSQNNKYKYASCLWCFNKIREAGGMGIYCHPFWIYRSRYNVPSSLNEYIFQEKPFDAYEAIGGYYVHQADSNTLQVAYYHEQREKGNRVPIVGVSDAHGCEKGTLIGWYYTIVFSPKLELSDIIESIKNCYSVAVEALPGEVVRAYGPFRLVKYALFLIKEVFPEHDEKCSEEGKKMIKYISK